MEWRDLVALVGKVVNKMNSFCLFHLDSSLYYAIAKAGAQHDEYLILLSKGDTHEKGEATTFTFFFYFQSIKKKEVLVRASLAEK